MGCVNGCGHPQFGKYETCCTHCKGPDGPHARGCHSMKQEKASKWNQHRAKPRDKDAGPSPSPEDEGGGGGEAQEPVYGVVVDPIVEPTVVEPQAETKGV